MRRSDHLPVGALYADGRATFRVWAPFREGVDVHITAPFDKVAPLDPAERGYYEAVIEGVESGARYFLRLDDEVERPDPASRFQREGVHGASEVANSEFPWSDGGWTGRPLAEYVIYELHTGTFSEEGTFAAVVEHLDDLVLLGVTAVELMPVAQFPGSRNWGYDGVYPYAPQNSYGGPRELKRLIDACHSRGLCVVLDVVYNHLGPEGCYLDDFGPYFTDRYRTPWGRAINFDGRGSDEVRNYFIGNALYWLDEFHVDALRLDAVHAIADPSPIPFLEDLGVAVDELADRTNRKLYLIAESAANDSRLVTPRDLGGYGLHAQWNDDFHHALVSRGTRETSAYYADYGSLESVARAWRDGFVYQGDYSVFHGHSHGRPPAHVTSDQLVVFGTNHDQIGNRPAGDRLSTRVGFEELKLLAGNVLLSPFVPLLFMGEEYGETTPFQYFVDHSDPALIEAVRRGRREEFAGFQEGGDVPDPQDEQTFLRSKLNREKWHAEPHAALWRYYKELLVIRETLGAGDRAQATADRDVVTVERPTAVVLANFGDKATVVRFPQVAGAWPRAIDSAGEAWGGPGAATPTVAEANGELELQPFSIVCYRRSGN